MRRYPISVSGFVIALVGFGLTRFTVTLAAMETPEQFLFTGVVPLVMGLSLSAFGVILAVGAYDTTLVRTTARWCVLGAATMAFLALLTALGTQPDMVGDPAAIREQAYLSTFLIGGAVGGTLTGLYAARNRRQQTDLRQQTNRLVLLNRLLRDQVINAAMAIKGHADVLEAQYRDDSIAVIDRQADSIVDIVENVKYLSGTADRDEISLGSMDLVACVEAEFEDIRSEHTDAAYSLDVPDEPAEVHANTQLHEVFRHLFENAIEYSDADQPRLAVTVETGHRVATVRVTDNGPGLPEEQRRLLEAGELAEFDDPTTGFGLNIVRLLVESFEGRIDTTVTEDGTTVELRLPRSGEVHALDTATGLGVSGISPARIGVAVGVGSVAGLTMALAMAVTGFDVGAIGELYGIDRPAIAMFTHEFHSIVFVLFYVAFLVAIPQSADNQFRNRLASGVLLGLSLWLLAAGVVMPLWLELTGIDATVPNVTVPSLIGHVVWGVTAGLLYHAGDRWLATRE